MLTYRGFLFTVCTAFITVLLASSVRAQNIYKCAGADGKISFSDSPCADKKTTESVYKKSGSQGGAVDISAPCKDFDRKRAKVDACIKSRHEKLGGGLATMEEDVRACGLTKENPDTLEKMLLCRLMGDCENGFAESCEVYCGEIGDLQKVFPGSGLESGPTSKLCLSKTKRVRGAN